MFNINLKMLVILWIDSIVGIVQNARCSVCVISLDHRTRFVRLLITSGIFFCGNVQLARVVLTQKPHHFVASPCAITVLWYLVDAFQFHRVSFCLLKSDKTLKYGSIQSTNRLKCTVHTRNSYICCVLLKKVLKFMAISTANNCQGDVDLIRRWWKKKYRKLLLHRVNDFPLGNVSIKYSKTASLLFYSLSSSP